MSLILCAMVYNCPKILLAFNLIAHKHNTVNKSTAAFQDKTYFIILDGMRENLWDSQNWRRQIFSTSEKF